MQLNDLIAVAIEHNASDLHLIVNYYPTIRVNGELFQLRAFPIITPEKAKELLLSLLNEEQKENLLTNKELDLSYDFNNYRFRVNLYFSKRNLCGSFRIIPSQIKTIEELNLPKLLYQCINFNQGLVLITGPTGEGKTTTLSALINEINKRFAKHIITIEDPIEYVYPPEKAIISQRELHEDTFSWNIALRAALREDPDVILVGEMRDYETIRLVLTAAETGHLVFSTLHTYSSPDTIDRIIDVFPQHQQNQIRNQLSSVLKMVISQRLLPRISRPGRIPAVEVLVNTSAVAVTIREGKTYLIDNILQTQEAEGQILFEKYLINLYNEGLISRETALSFAIRPKILEKLFKI